MDPHSSEHSTLSDYLRVLRRGKWLIVTAAVLVAGSAYAFSHLQKPRYQGSAEVLLNRQRLVNSLNNINDQTLAIQPDRLAQTEADVARAPAIARRTLAAVGVVDRSVADFLGQSNVAPKTDADLLVFRVSDLSRRLAQALATSYARQYIVYRTELDTAAIRSALAEVNRRMRELEAAGRTRTAFYNALAEKQQQLNTLATLQAANANLIKPAQRAVQVQPKPARNTALGFVLGLVLGVGLAFMREALDTRVRSANEISRRLGLPLLARIPAPPRALRLNDRLVLLDDPQGTKSEPFRVLRTNLEFVNLDHHAKTIMVTSAVPGEGKSTTAANLGIALASAGAHVVLVDLDLRKPYIGHFFELNGAAGLTSVALGHAALGEAVTAVPFNKNGHAPRGDERSGGRLEILRAGLVPPNPGEFVGSHAVGEILESLTDRADIVLVDAPPILGVGDALALSAKVDALLLVTRLKLLRRPLLSELSRVLQAAPAPALGFIVTDAAAEEGYGYGYAYDAYAAYGYTREAAEASS